MQIQSSEKLRYNNLFVNLGALHIKLAFFEVFGKYIDESGAPYLLMESGVLKKGSLNGFIKGKSYNRGKGIH